MQVRWLAALVALALVVPFPVAATSSSGAPPLWSIDDPADDASAIQPGLPGPPSKPLFAHADIRRLEIAREDELGIDFVLTVNDIKGDLDSYSGLGFQSMYLSILFGLEGTTFQYEIEGYIGGFSSDVDADGVFHAAYGFSDLRISSTTGGSCCLYQPVQVTLDDAANAFHFWVSKESLLGRVKMHGYYGDRANALPRPASLAVGDQFVKLRAWTYYQVTPFFGVTQVEDKAPNVGNSEPYVLKHGVANSVVKLQLRDGSPELAIQSGVNQTIPFTVTNLADGKRILKLSYGLEGPEAKVAKYKVRGPATVTIPGAESRNFTFSLDAAPDANALDGVRVSIRGDSLAHPDELAAATAIAQPGAALSPSSNVLYFHAHQTPFVNDALEPVACRGIFGSCNIGFLSPSKEDPRDTGGQDLYGYSYFGGDTTGSTFYVRLIQATPTPLAFQPGQPIELALKLHSGTPQTGVAVHVTLQYYTGGEDGGVLFDEQQTVDIDSSGAPVSFKGPVRLGGLRGPQYLPAGTQLQLRLQLRSTLSPTADAAFFTGGTALDPKASTIKLPIAELPEELKIIARASPFQLTVVGDREGFINPGEARLYNVTVLNQGQEAARVSLAASLNSPKAWIADVLPGTQYQLAAGDSVTVGVLVHAPADVKEGDNVTVQVSAQSPEPVKTPPTVQLSAVVTEFDLPDDGGTFHADKDDAAKLVVPTKGNSPGPGFASLVAVALVGLGLARRRKA